MRVRPFGSLFVIIASMAAASADVDYASQVAPLLTKHCADCHGADTQESGLRVDRRNSLLRGGDSGEPSIVAGNAADSHLMELVAGTKTDLVMPPEGERLSPAEITILSEWIDGGAIMPKELHGAARLSTDHWSFQNVRRPDLPPLSGSFLRTGVDPFVARRLAQEELLPSSLADSETLIRRLLLVMHGLPPGPEQMTRYRQRLNDPESRDAAWHQIVNEVLDSPRYGERWARHWLDIIRFGETHGFETNRERPNAWHFRDYVIEAFNSDMPYDQFVREQIVGDALGADVATGFLVAGPHDLVKSSDINLTLMQRQDELSDLINVTGTTFMGLTLGCARCHNHKFDPITQRDFYAVQAIFAGVNHGDRAMPLTEDQQTELGTVTDRKKELRKLLTEFIPPAAAQLILLDDDQPVEDGVRGVRHLVVRTGEGVNPAGTERGHRDDPGADDHSPNLSGGRYSWWTNKTGQDVAAYQPVARGRFRVWVSWGHGHNTHTRDAVFVLDADGDVATRTDQTILTTVSQAEFADGTGEVVGKSLWSGFHDTGVHDLLPSATILVRGGRTGTALTSDVVLLESVPNTASQTVKRRFPRLKPPVSARHNIENIAPTEARFVRFTIRATNASQPCLDELEVFSGTKNVALNSVGTKPTSSGNLAGYEIHQLKHINDGEFGNGKSWISDQAGLGWVQLEFSTSHKIDRIEWARDRDGKYSDRVATDYEIEASLDGTQWFSVASSLDRLPFRTGAANEPQYELVGVAPDRAKLGQRWLAELQAVTKAEQRLSSAQQIYAGNFGQPPPTHRLYRGDPLTPREEVAPDVLEVIGRVGLKKDAREQQRRLRFAQWLTEKDHPLTARVIVNRLWQHHFGTGLVSTPNDFGRNGVPASHPQLLDWLAAELVEHDWSLKHVHRLILHSSTWQQSSTPREDAMAADAATQLLWRFPPRRLEAEAIRDSILAVSGGLDLRMGGPGFSGFEVQMENVRHFFPKQTFGPEDFRRMVYMTKVRQEQESVFGAFDCPDASQVISKRSRSTTPLQALNLMNSAFVVQQSGVLADRLLQEQQNTPDRVRRAMQLCYGRVPEPEELTEATAFVDAHGMPAFCRAVLNSSEFLFIP